MDKITRQRINGIEYYKIRIISSGEDGDSDTLVYCTVHDGYEEMFLYSNGTKNPTSELLESLLMTVKFN